MSSDVPNPPPPPPPPQPGGPAPSAGGGGGGGGLDDNIAGLLAYFLVPGIIFLLIEPYNKNPFVRFHSVQSIGLAAVSVVSSFIPLIGWCVIPPIILVVAIICMVKAYQNEKFMLPVLGKFAEEQANKI